MSTNDMNPDASMAALTNMALQLPKHLAMVDKHSPGLALVIRKHLIDTLGVVGSGQETAPQAPRRSALETRQLLGKKRFLQTHAMQLAVLCHVKHAVATSNTDLFERFCAAGLYDASKDQGAFTTFLGRMKGADGTTPLIQWESRGLNITLTNAGEDEIKKPRVSAAVLAELKKMMPAAFTHVP